MPGRGLRNPAIIRLAWISGAIVVLAMALFALARAKPDPDQLWLSVQEDWKAGRLDRAQAAMDRLLRLRPATDEDYMVLAQLAMARGRDAEALQHLAHIGDGSPMAARARTLEGRVELRSQRARRAEAAFLRAVRLDPDDPVLRRDLILFYCMQRRRSELSEQFAALSRLTPLDFNQMLLWSSSLAASWDPSETAPIMEGFVEADPDDRLSRLTLAEALRRLRRIDDAKAVLSPLPSSRPRGSSHPGANRRGSGRHRRGRATDRRRCRSPSRPGPDARPGPGPARPAGRDQAPPRGGRRRSA